MDSIDRQTIASSVAVILYLLLVYALLEQLDCECEPRAEAATELLRPGLRCESPSLSADTREGEPERLTVRHTSQPTHDGVPRRGRFEP